MDIDGKQLAADTSIDEHALDVEWLRLPGQFAYYHGMQATARQAADEARDALNLAKARAEMDVRSNPDEYDLPKVTEATVAAAVAAHENVEAATADFNKARYMASLVDGALASLDAKRRALENLVRLLGMEYMAKPEVPQDISTHITDWEQRHAAKVQSDKKAALNPPGAKEKRSSRRSHRRSS